MNINDYRKAMDHIAPNNELKERIMHKETSQKRYVPVHRILAGTLMAALMLTCVASVALTASPELRMAVKSFFHIEEREQVPGQTDIDQPDISQPDINQPDISQVEISQVEIGDLVKDQYIKMDQNYGHSGLGIVQLGVADLEKGTFIAFDREGYGNLYEEGIGWNDDSTVSIRARSSDRETRYIILYRF